MICIGGALPPSHVILTLSSFVSPILFIIVGFGDGVGHYVADANEWTNILSITTSEFRITCLIEKDKVKQAVRVLHKAFELEKV